MNNNTLVEEVILALDRGQEFDFWHKGALYGLTHHSEGWQLAKESTILALSKDYLKLFDEKLIDGLSVRTILENNLLDEGKYYIF